MYARSEVCPECNWSNRIWAILREIHIEIELWGLN